MLNDVRSLWGHCVPGLELAGPLTWHGHGYGLDQSLPSVNAVLLMHADCASTVTSKSTSCGTVQSHVRCLCRILSMAHLGSVAEPEAFLGKLDQTALSTCIVAEGDQDSAAAYKFQ